MVSDSISYDDIRILNVSLLFVIEFENNEMRLRGSLILAQEKFLLLKCANHLN